MPVSNRLAACAFVSLQTKCRFLLPLLEAGSYFNFLAKLRIFLTQMGNKTCISNAWLAVRDTLFIIARAKVTACASGDLAIALSALVCKAAVVVWIISG